MTENKVTPSQPATEKLEEAISTILRAAFCTSKHGLGIRTLALQEESFPAKVRIKRMKEKSFFSNDSLKL